MKSVKLSLLSLIAACVIAAPSSADSSAVARGSVVRAQGSGMWIVQLADGDAQVRDVFTVTRNGKVLGECMVFNVHGKQIEVVPKAAFEGTPQRGDSATFARHAGPPTTEVAPPREPATAASAPPAPSASAPPTSVASAPPAENVRPASWQPFTSAAGHFRCDFPSSPKTTTIPRSTPIGTVNVEAAAGGNQQIICSTATYRLPIGDNVGEAPAQIRQQIYDKELASLPGLGFQIRSRRAFTLAGRQGIEVDFVVSQTQAPGTGRILLVGPRVYVWMAVQGRGGPDERARFLSSFVPTR